MEKKFLEDLGLTEEQVTKILSQHTSEIDDANKETARYKKEAETYKIKSDGFETQLKDVNKEIQAYKDMDIEGIKKSAEDWKIKYETDTKVLNETIAQKDYDYAAKDFMNQYDFIDADAKEIATLRFKAKEFKLEDGKFLGADDFMKQYKEEHKALFKEEQKQEVDVPPMPQIVKPTGGSEGSNPQNKFNFSSMFTPVRKVEK
jgi:hypothetical protein|nr:MAG TPA: minor structural protein [Caudoviricetes sp.]